MDPVVARTWPCTLAHYLDDRFLMPDHVWTMSEAIADAVWGDGPDRLIFTMPPRHGKSEHTSHWTPVWFLENFPDRRVLLGSYEATFAAKWGRLARDTIEQNTDRLFVRVNPDARAVHEWFTTEGGGMSTAGTGGPFTGKGGDLLLIDDPIKNPEEAASEVYREKLWEWFNEAAYTRLEPGGVAAVIHTRWHEDDLIGRLIREHGDRWHVVNFPAIAEEDDALGRHPGDALWPERYSAEDLKEIFDQIGSKSTASLYQQRPSPEGGGIFQRKHFRYWYTDSHGMYALQHGDGVETVSPGSCVKFQCIDTAQKAKTSNDYTVVVTVCMTPKRQLLVLDVARERLEIPEQLPFIRQQKAKWNPRWVGVEEKASGIGIIQEARRQGLTLRPLYARRSKIARARVNKPPPVRSLDPVQNSVSAAALYEQGACFHQRGAAWLDDFERELLGFPNGVHDDQVDALVHAVCSMAAPQSALGIPSQRRRETSETGMALGGFQI